jgi:hypothetical protein
MPVAMSGFLMFSDDLKVAAANGVVYVLWREDLITGFVEPTHLAALNEATGGKLWEETALGGAVWKTEHIDYLVVDHSSGDIVVGYEPGNEAFAAARRTPSGTWSPISLPSGSQPVATTTGVGNVVFIQRVGSCGGWFNSPEAVRAYVYTYQDGALVSPELAAISAPGACYRLGLSEPGPVGTDSIALVENTVSSAEGLRGCEWFPGLGNLGHICSTGNVGHPPPVPIATLLIYNLTTGQSGWHALPYLEIPRTAEPSETQEYVSEVRFAGGSPSVVWLESRAATQNVFKVVTSESPVGAAVVEEPGLSAPSGTISAEKLSGDGSSGTYRLVARAIDPDGKWVPSETSWQIGGEGSWSEGESFTYTFTNSAPTTITAAVFDQMGHGSLTTEPFTPDVSATGGTGTTGAGGQGTTGSGGQGTTGSGGSGKAGPVDGMGVPGSSLANAAPATVFQQPKIVTGALKERARHLEGEVKALGKVEAVWTGISVVGDFIEGNWPAILVEGELFVASSVVEGAEEALFQEIAADPPDPHYRRPVALRSAHVRSLHASRYLSRATAAEETHLLQIGAKAASCGHAALLAFERFKGAQQAHDAHWERIQLRSLVTYSGCFARALSAQAKPTASGAWPLAAAGPREPSSAEVNTVHRWLRRHGFPASVRRALRSAGVSPEVLRTVASGAPSPSGDLSGPSVSVPSVATTRSQLESLAAGSRALSQKAAQGLRELAPDTSKRQRVPALRASRH